MHKFIIHAFNYTHTNTYIHTYIHSSIGSDLRFDVNGFRNHAGIVQKDAAVSVRAAAGGYEGSARQLSTFPYSVVSVSVDMFQMVVFKCTDVCMYV